MNNRKVNLLWSYTKGSRLVFFIGLISVILSSIFNFVGPLIIAVTVDSIIDVDKLSAPKIVLNIVDFIGGTGALRNALWLCTIAFIGTMILRSIFSFIRTRNIAVASESIAKRIRDSVYNHLQKLPYSYHAKAETGDLIQRCTTDVETVRRFISTQLAETFRIITMIVVALIILLPINPMLTLFSLILTPPMVVISFWFFSRVGQEFTKVEEADGHLSTVLQESLTGVRVVRAFGRQSFERNKFQAANLDYRVKSMKLVILFAKFYGGTDIFVMVQTLLAMTLGIIAAVNGEISVGEFIIFISYVQMMIWPIKNFGRVLADMGKAMIATGRLDEILSVPIETSGDNPKTPPLDKEIVFDNVDFGYDEVQVLKKMSFTVKNGETVAILGATGSGKSSLVLLLQRLYDYQGGSIRIGDVEIKEIEKSYLRNRIGIVLQEPFLYSRTIKENIAIASHEDNDELIYESARTASVHDVINEFELGYDTVVGERGVTLSGGQKQRIAIARTILRDSDILIFDDSLSAVDTQTDSQIRYALQKRRTGVTTFIISHRIATLMEADLILVMEDGHIVQQGNHQQLINMEGLYSRIWNIQSSNETTDKQGGN